MTVSDLLVEAAKLFDERNKTYGDTYKRTGPAMKSILPEVTLNTSEDYTRMFILITIVGKIIRYSNNFNNGGHDDSLADIAVYSNMLREIDIEVNSKMLAKDENYGNFTI